MPAKLIVVGAGSIGRRHAENLAALGADVQLIGWRDTNAQQLAQTLAQGMDGLVIATATQVRLPLIQVAASAKVPFYIEKPLAFSPSGVEVMFDAAKAVANRSMIGFMMRYHPAFRDLAQVDLSDTYQFDLSIGHDVTQWRANWQFSQSYAAKSVGGGVLLDLCHELDMAACLFPGLTLGPVESLGHAAYPGVDVASRVLLQSPHGASGSVSMDYLAPRLIRRAQIAGSNATRTYDFAAQSYQTATHAGVTTTDHPLERNQMFLDAMRDFLALIAGKPTSDNPSMPRLDLTRESCDLIAAAHARRRFIGRITKDIP